MQRNELAPVEVQTRSNTRWRAVLPAMLALAIAALTLYAYRDLLARPFAADDYQWLLAVRGLSLGDVVARAFDAGAQSHFYRPLAWLQFWAQGRAFGLDPRGYHAVSLALHLLNAALLGWLAYRVTSDERRATSDQTATSSAVGRWSILAAGVVALHPAPFEAITWISAQSELLAAALLLAALHLWLPKQEDKEMGRQGEVGPRLPISLSPHLLVSTLALGLALLAKESAVIGLPLLVLADSRSDRAIELRGIRRYARYLLPALVMAAYVALQVAVERRNYLLRLGGYGPGPQLVLYPLRSLALIVAPLPGTEHADAAWLVTVGAAAAIALIGFTMYDVRFRMRRQRNQSPVVERRSSVRLVLALALTLLPTAPFASPPDSRYLYLPVMAAALLMAGIGQRRKTKDKRASSPFILRRILALVSLLFVLLLAWWSAGELHARENRFAAGAGPGGSLWRLATSVCAEGRPERMVLVEPPLAGPHAEAIVELACGPDVRALIVGRDQVANAIEGHTVVIGFPGGSAQVEQRTQ
jgi:hypothetical protein